MSMMPHFLGFLLFFIFVTSSSVSLPFTTISLLYSVVPQSSLHIFMLSSSLYSSPTSITIVLVALSTQIYAISYMGEHTSSHRLYSLTLVFLLSMVGLVNSSSFFLLLTSWDLLGISSYFLILHYYSPNSSSSAKITMISNRAGDFFMILTLFSLLSTSPSTWLALVSPYPYLFSILITLSSLTKSSQFPFSCWLPEAMAAPTPISSLVHSSTLVTAGYFLIWLAFYTLSSFSLFTLSLMTGFTLLLASLSSFFLSDLKKLVAFSTLSQVSLIMYLVAMCSPSLSLFHMITHALFKSTLFMLVGSILHSAQGSQDFRHLTSPFSSTYLQPLVSLPVFNLLGLTFTSGFLSKELSILSLLSTSPSTNPQI